MSIASSVFPALSCTSVKASGLILRSLIHFELILVQDDKRGSNFSFLHTDKQFSQPHLMMSLSFFIICFWYLCQKLGGHRVEGIVFYSVPLVFISAFLPVPCCFKYSVVEFGVRYWDTISVALFVQYCLVYSWSFGFLSKH
jgi:hypothetical protein